MYSIFQIGHIFYGKNYWNNTFITMPCNYSLSTTYILCFCDIFMWTISTLSLESSTLLIHFTSISQHLPPIGSLRHYYLIVDTSLPLPLHLILFCCVQFLHTLHIVKCLELLYLVQDLKLSKYWRCTEFPLFTIIHWRCQERKT